MLRVESHTRPVVGCTCILVCVLWPGFVSGLARQRNRVKGPAKLSSAKIECLNVTGGRRLGFRIAAADDDEVLVNHSGRCEGDGECAEVALSAGNSEAFAQINVAALAEAVDQVSGFGIEAVEEVHHACVNATVLTVVPVDDAASGLASNDTGIELPLQFSGSSIEGDNFVFRRIAEHCAADDEMVGLNASLLACVINPRLLELMHVVAGDLSEMRVVIVVESAVVSRPTCVCLSRTAERNDGHENERQD